jgi:stage II sporulation protein AA (anti-sigma F factor antagonist)
MNRLVTPDASGPAPVARVSGEIDLTNAPRLRDELLAMTADIEALIVDLTEVPYLDSAGVKALFQVARDLRRRDQAFLVTLPTGSPLRRVLKITGFHEVAAICDDVEAAFNLLARRPGGGA